MQMHWLGLFVCLSASACLPAENPEEDGAPDPNGDVALDTVGPDTTAEVSAEVGDGSLGEATIGETNGDATIDTTPFDTVPGDGHPSPTACQSGPLGATGVAVFDERVINMTPVIFDGAALIGSRARAAGPEDYDSDLVRQDLVTGAEVNVTSEDDLVMAIDGRDGALVYVLRDQAVGLTTLRYRGADGAQVTLFEHQSVTLVGSRALWPWPFGWERPVRLVADAMTV